MQLMTGTSFHFRVLILAISATVWTKIPSNSWLADNRIRHIPVITEGGMIGMVSIGDVVRAVVSEHRDELKRLNAFIQGGY